MIPKWLLVHKGDLYNTTVRYVDRPLPHRLTQTRHSKSGHPCHHFEYHRLTCDEYDDLRERADGHCEICDTPEAETGGRRLVIDHFHGRRLWIVRGLLCDRCNSLMSCFDGTKNWGANRRLELLARSYQLLSWQRVTPEERAAMEAIQSGARSRWA